MPTSETPVGGKFGFNGMSSAFHGPVLGPDGRLYWCGGQHGWRLGDAGPGLELNAEAWKIRAPGVFSCWPDGSDPEALGHGGICNPTEVTFTAEGEVFGTVAVYDNVGGRHDALLHWISGGVFNLTERNYRSVRLTGDVLTPLSRRGHVAPAGVTRYRGTAFGPEYRDNVFLCEFNTHKVYRLTVQRAGATYTSQDEVFLSSPSPNVHFTDVFEDADGSLLVIDTGGWFRYGCPTSKIAKPSILGAIYRVRRTGSRRPTDPRGEGVAWVRSSPEDLVRRLDDDRFAVRDRAVAELARRGDAALPALSQSIKGGSKRTRRGAVWALTRIGSPAARTVVRSALEDADFSVRLSATRSAGTRRDSAALPHLLRALTADTPPALRREAATALGRLGVSGAVPSLLAALASTDGDRFLEHALVFALIRIDDREATLRGLSHGSPDVRRGSLLALDQMQSGGLTPTLVTPLLSTGDPKLHRAAVGIVMQRSEWLDEIVPLLEAWLSGEGDEDDASVIRGALVVSLTDRRVQALVTRALDTAAAPVVLGALLDADVSEAPAEWRAPLERILAGGDPSAAVLAARAVEHLRLQGLDGPLRRLRSSPAVVAEVRIAAARTLAREGHALDAADFDFVRGLLDGEAGSELRLEAAKVLELSPLTPSQLQAVVVVARAAGPLELPVLVAAFRDVNDDEIGRTLIEALEASPGVWTLSSDQIEDLVGGFSPAVRETAAPLIAQLRVSEQGQQARMAELEQSLRGGDVPRGEALFFGKATCHLCHRVAGRGGEVGPDLSTIGQIRTRRDLLEAIAFPSETFARQYEPYSLLTKDGQIIEGRVFRDTETHVDLIDARGDRHRFRRSQIERFVPSAVSTMPQGLERQLTAQELSDVLAYLGQLR